MKDFLGNEFGPGDLVVYPKSSGRSVALVKGTVLKFNPSGSVQIQPETESWGGGRERSGTTRYVDTRTGKTFDPYHDKNVVHMERDRGYLHKETGEFVSNDEMDRERQRIIGSFDHRYSRVAQEAVYEYTRQYTYVLPVWKDYVKTETTVKSVTITRTDNIVLIEKRDG